MLRFCTVAYRNADIVTRLCQSISTYCSVNFEIYCWDNSETPLVALDALSKKIPNFKVFRSGANIGFTKAINSLVNADSQSLNPEDSLILINPDAYLASPIDEAKILKLRALNGICGLAVFNDIEKIQRQQSARSFPNLFTSVAGREGLLTRLWPSNAVSKKYLRRDLDQTKTQRVDWVSGCAMYVTCEIWKQLGGFDERYFLYADDVDLGRKAQTFGIPVFYAPLIDVVHESRSMAGKNPWLADFYHHRGMAKYYWKWAGPWGRLMYPIIVCAITGRFLFRRLMGHWGRTAT